MDATDIVRAFFASLEAQHWETAAGYLARDFVFRGDAPLAQEHDKEQFLAGQHALQAAVPDWSFHLDIDREEGDTVWAVAQITGTHHHDFVPPPFLDIPIPQVTRATGQQLHLPPEVVKCIVRDGQICVVHVQIPPGSATPELFP